MSLLDGWDELMEERAELEYYERLKREEEERRGKRRQFIIDLIHGPKKEVIHETKYIYVSEEDTKKKRR